MKQLTMLVAFVMAMLFVVSAEAGFTATPKTKSKTTVENYVVGQTEILQAQPITKEFRLGIFKRMHLRRQFSKSLKETRVQVAVTPAAFVYRQAVVVPHAAVVTEKTLGVER